jgi:hypothetical protein
LDETSKKIKFPQSNPKNYYYYFVIFKVLRNIIKIYYFFISLGPAARARLAASHVPPARARIELLCPSKAKHAPQAPVASTTQSGFLRWKTTRMQFCNRETKTINKKKHFCLGTLKFPDQVV